MMIRWDLDVYVCTVCRVRVLAPVESEVVSQGVSYGWEPLSFPCPQGCDDGDDYEDVVAA